MRKENIIKINHFRLHYLDGATLVGDYDMPLLKMSEAIPSNVICFNEINQIKRPECHWVDFFINDYMFEHIWNLIHLSSLEMMHKLNFLSNDGINNLCYFLNTSNLDTLYKRPNGYLKKLKRFAGIISPDFSLYPEMPLSMRIYNCFRSRVMAFYMQEKGLNIIPSVAWANEDDFEYCFDGIPKHSSVAISSNGCKADEYSKEVFLVGVEALQHALQPKTLVVCGSVDELEKYNNILCYSSFSERRKNRETAFQIKRDKQLSLLCEI